MFKALIQMKIFQYGYKTTFEFEYNGNVINKTMKTRRQFTVGNEYEGLYLADGSKNCITVEGEGSSIGKGVALIFIIASLAIMFLGIGLLGTFETKILFEGFIIFFILIFISIALYNVINNRKKAKNVEKDNERIYNKNVNTKNSPDLIRYKPDEIDTPTRKE